MRVWITLLLAASVWLLPSTALAFPKLYQTIARETQVPVELLYGIALQETQAALGRHLTRPWPWTLNVCGTGYRYGSRAAVFVALNRWLKKGETRIDVGLMQIHWRYHSAKLGNSWIALSPRHNLRVAAVVLRACFRKSGTWKAATGCYHSTTPWRAAAYQASVEALMAGGAP
jgi:hypothetical protein